MNTNLTGFQWFSKIFALDESSLSVGRVKDAAQVGIIGHISFSG